jgi:hypothetical protein
MAAQDKPGRTDRIAGLSPIRERASGSAALFAAQAWPRSAAVRGHDRRAANHPFCDGHHILGGAIPIAFVYSQPHPRFDRTDGRFLMRKFGFIAAGAFIVACFGGWMASTNARVAPPASTVSIAPLQMMGASASLPEEHFVDYSLVYP